MAIRFYLGNRPDKKGDCPIRVSISIKGTRLLSTVGYRSPIICSGYAVVEIHGALTPFLMKEKTDGSLERIAILQYVFMIVFALIKTHLNELFNRIL